MNIRSIFIALPILLCVFKVQAQNSANITGKIALAEQFLKQHPKDQQAWQQLYVLMNNNYIKLTATERTRLRTILEQYGIWSTGTTYTSAEPGTRIIIKGHVINAQGKPIPNASLHIFQTDSRGYYTPLDSAEKKMGEPDARLFCFIKTDSAGSFEIHTIRPASYPIKYNGRTIPQHVHNNITAKGYRDKNLQMVFDDDPAMNDFWRQWAASNGFPILKLNNVSSQRIATLEIKLLQ